MILSGRLTQQSDRVIDVMQLPELLIFHIYLENGLKKVGEDGPVGGIKMKIILEARFQGYILLPNPRFAQNPV
jgi:hypothetical protein